jgi:flavin-binding protein dodecin
VHAAGGNTTTTIVDVGGEVEDSLEDAVEDGVDDASSSSYDA